VPEARIEPATFTALLMAKAELDNALILRQPADLFGLGRV